MIFDKKSEWREVESHGHIWRENSLERTTVRGPHGLSLFGRCKEELRAQGVDSGMNKGKGMEEEIKESRKWRREICSSRSYEVTQTIVKSLHHILHIKRGHWKIWRTEITSYDFSIKESLQAPDGKYIEYDLQRWIRSVRWLQYTIWEMMVVWATGRHGKTWQESGYILKTDKKIYYQESDNLRVLWKAIL